MQKLLALPVLLAVHQVYTRSHAANLLTPLPIVYTERVICSPLISASRVPKQQEARTNLPGPLSRFPILLSASPVEDVVDNAVLLRLCGRHDEVTLHVPVRSVPVTGRLLWLINLFVISRMRKISRAWMSMSVACPLNPPIEG